MNNVQLVGRLTRDPDVRVSNGGTSVARFTVACDRRFKSDGAPTADFPTVIAFGKTAEFIEKFFLKGMRIGVTGRIQTGSYQDKDGRKVYTTEVVADSVEFVESKNANHSDQKNDNAGFMEIPDGADDELPFN